MRKRYHPKPINFDMKIKIQIWITSLLFLLSCSPHTFENGFKSAYDFENKQINSFNLNMISDAPLRVSASAKVFVSQEEAFKLVAEDLHQWFPGLEKFKYDHSGASQITFADGSVRTGIYKNDKMVEVIRKWEAPYFYVYQIDLDHSEAYIPIKNHMGVFTVERGRGGAVYITWKQYFDPKIPFTGPIVSWVMGNIAHKAFADLSEKFGKND